MKLFNIFAGFAYIGICIVIYTKNLNVYVITKKLMCSLAMCELIIVNC